MNIRIINLGFSVVAICILLIDFFVIDEFNIERGYLDVFGFLLILNTCRLVFENKVQVHIIVILINLGLLSFLLYNIPILAILGFGIGFTGRDFSVFMAITLVVNLSLIWALFIETIKLNSIRTKNSTM